MKYFTTIKVGYTSGIYGCSNEYFTTIYTDESEGLKSIHFYGMYGAEERIARLLKNAGFKEKYTSSSYGKMTKKDIMPNFESENKTLDKLQAEFQLPFSTI